MEGPLVRAIDLTKIYRKAASEVRVFEHLHFEVQPGRMIAIVGPSGAGKSSLLHLLGGLDRPTAGKVMFRDEDIFGLESRALARFRNRHVGFVYQFHHLLPEFTALENVMMPRLIRGESVEVAKRPAEHILGMVGLAHRGSHRVGEISGGEQQRVAIARALVGDPELLLADEPTGNLDQKTGDSVFQVLKGLHDERGLTSVIVTHNERVAVQCHEVWEMQGGELRTSVNRA